MKAMHSTGSNKALRHAIQGGFSLLLICMLLGVGALMLDVGSASAQEADRYYPETGHTIDARFVEFFDQNGSLAIMGYPITDSFIDPLSGWLVQYFQNARLELILDQATGSMKVHLCPLGEWVGGWDLPLESSQISASSNPGCRYFAESGHQVCFAFLDFFNRYSEKNLFGYPISEFKIENDRIVQYFQNFRLDWYPAAIGGGQVKVAPLGRVHFDMLMYDRSLLNPNVPSNRILNRVVDLQLKASVAEPIIGSSGVQEVYLLVRDQNLNPVPGVAVTLFAHFPDGDRTLVMPVTDEGGISRLQVAFKDQDPGNSVALEFWVVYGDIIKMTCDSFMIWW